MSKLISKSEINAHTIYYMKLALKEAKKAAKIKEIPVGAVIVNPVTKEVIAKAYNKVITKNNPSYHAEILVITKASKYIKNYRLNNLELYVTLEPCAMCAGAIIHSRISKLYFGAFDTKGGSVVNNASLFKDDYNYNHKPLYAGGILENECSSMLTNFFKELRVNKQSFTNID